MQPDYVYGGYKFGSCWSNKFDPTDESCRCRAEFIRPTGNEDALNQVYNVAVGERTMLNELYEMIKSLLAEERPDFSGASAVYRDFRAGDVRHSLADISKVKRMPGYTPSHRISEGMKEAMAWYIQDIDNK